MGRRPCLGFLGAGWIGRNRMNGLAATGLADIVAVADPVSELASSAAREVGCPRVAGSLEDLLALDLDGVVIATPSALHAEQSIAALQRGLAVFCQKPLGRNASEVARVVKTARIANRLLDVDFSYRFTDGLQKIRELVRSGAIGQVYAADLTFHNAYGPDKPWFYDRALSGGGCLVDLGVHLVDLALWIFDRPVAEATGRLFTQGTPWDLRTGEVEDFASMRLDFHDGATAQLACSWRLPAGRDAIIEASFYGTRGGARWRNINGSFVEFVTERLDGTRTTTISEPPDDWGPRALIDWTRQLQASGTFDPEIDRVTEVSTILDRVYSSVSMSAPSR